MFYVAVVPALALSAYMIYYLSRLQKHDRVLYRFCQIRREMMEFFREHGSELSPEEYSSARRLVEVLNLTIHNYKHERTRMFDGRKLLRTLRDYEASVDAVVLADNSRDNERIRAFRTKFEKTLFFAFFEYTPFFRSELALRVLLVAATLLAKLGLQKMSNVVRQLQSTLPLLKRQMQEFGSPGGRYAH
jgi:hypothetical protein